MTQSLHEIITNMHITNEEAIKQAFEYVVSAIEQCENICADLQSQITQIHYDWTTMISTCEQMIKQALEKEKDKKIYYSYSVENRQINVMYNDEIVTTLQLMEDVALHQKIYVQDSQLMLKHDESLITLKIVQSHNAVSHINNDEIILDVNFKNITYQGNVIAIATS